METRKSFLPLPFSSLLIFFLIIISLCEGEGSSEEKHVKAHEGPLVKKSQIKTIVDTEYGEISAIMVKEGHKTPPYHLQFFTLEPNSVFLPVLLHADMVFYVYTGSGRLTWANEDGGTGTIDLREGDVCSLGEGFVFYIQSNLEAQRNKLRIYAMFSNTEDSTFDSSIGAYSRINNLVKGFDKKIMQAAFKVPEDLVEAITNKTETPAIVHAVPEKKDKHKHNSPWELEDLFLKYFTGILPNSKKLKTYNIFTNDPDFKNVHGWTTTVTKKQLKQLKRHNIGFLMVNLTMASMLGPHWNPRATEVAVVLQGEGMVKVVCGSNNDTENTDECQNKRFRVKQGDVFVVPRFHPMAHMSFENEPLAFMGFSTAAKKNNPQFLVGKGSVLEILDRQILATSLGVSNRTIDKLLASPDESIIFGCESCAEEEERLMKEEEEKEKEEEEKGKKEEKEEEESEKSKEEEEERERQRTEEEEEEEVRRREEARKREEEAARRQQEEREQRREEEEARRQEEERREEEEVRREKEREREKEAAREQEKARRQREEEEARREREREEEAGEREEEQRREEEAAAEREQEKARRQQEEREKKREEEARREREREEAAAREEEQRREEAAAKRQEEKERRRQEEEARREREREEEEAEARREREEEEAEARREREREEEEAEEGEEEAARRQQEERERRREEEGGREREEEEEEERSERERGGGGRRRRQRRREEEEAERGREEAPAEGEEEAARRQQEERERRRGEREREEEQSERERGGGGRRRRQKRGEERGDESETSWEEEEARREQEERERRRERGRDNNSMKRKVEGRSFEGRRVLKMRNVNV